ncbi:MAG: hypothetical protein ACKO3N_21675, partial [Verrucomicrobiota bacterium]
LVWVAVWGVGVFPEWHHCFHVHRLADPPVESSGLEVAAGLPLPDPDDSGDADPDTCLLCQIQRGQAWYPAVTPDHVPVQLQQPFPQPAFPRQTSALGDLPDRILAGRSPPLA